MVNELGTVRERASAERKRAVALRRRTQQLRDQLAAGVDRTVEGLRSKNGAALGAHGDRFVLRMPRLPSFVALARHDFRRWLEQSGLREEDVQDIVLALSVACANRRSKSMRGGAATRSGSRSATSAAGARGTSPTRSARQAAACR